MQQVASTVTPFRYRAFISYSHRDKAWADWLHKALETYVIPRRLVGEITPAGPVPRRLAPVFRDRDELASAHDLGTRVNQALAQSANLIVICSPRAAASRWVDEEVLAFKRLGREERIFCLIVDGEPHATELPGRAAEECFVPALRHAIDAQGRRTGQPAEPIAADARPDRDGKANAKLKLIAGLIGVGFDSLKQRELQRRARRLTAIAALALAVMTLTSTLAVFALVSRHAAVVARQAAVVARQAAERRQRQAEDLVGFMLGDLNDKLAQVQRLDIMQSVDDKAMEYFASLPTTDVNDVALAQRAKALEKIGAVRFDQGHPQEALRSFRASTHISARLAAAAPADLARQTAYARTLSYIGLSEWTRGRLDAAQHQFEAARNVLLRARALSAGNLPLIYELQTADNNIGHVQEALGKSAAARTAYRETLTLSRMLVAADPDMTHWVAALGDAHNNLGMLALQRGDLAEAVAEYRADDLIETRLSARDPKDTNQRENVLRVRAILGRTLVLAGDMETGIEHMQQAVDIAGQLVRVDPRHTDFQFKRAVYLSQLARMMRLKGDLPAARAQTAQALQIFARLTAKASDNAGWQQQAANARLEQAAETLAGGHARAATDQGQAALEILQRLRTAKPLDHGLLLDTVTGQLLLAEAGRTTPAARALRIQAWRALEGTKNGAEDPRLQALQIEALLGLQRTAEARPLIARLWASGYGDPALRAVLRRAGIDYPVNARFMRRMQHILHAAPESTPPGAAASSTTGTAR